MYPFKGNIFKTILSVNNFEIDVCRNSYINFATVFVKYTRFINGLSIFIVLLQVKSLS